jgi:hypothetical protein
MGNSHYEILTKYDLMSTVAGLMEQVRWLHRLLACAICVGAGGGSDPLDTL